MDWLVPGSVRDKCIGLIKSLPKKKRKNFIPISELIEKISIENISRIDENTYPTFDLVLRDFYDSDEKRVVLESFRNKNIGPKNKSGTKTNKNRSIWRTKLDKPYKNKVSDVLGGYLEAPKIPSQYIRDFIFTGFVRFRPPNGPDLFKTVIY